MTPDSSANYSIEACEQEIKQSLVSIMKIRIQLHDQLMWEPIDQETQQWDKRQKLQPVNGAISIPYRIVFPELFEKKKKKMAKIFWHFLYFFP